MTPITLRIEGTAIPQGSKTVMNRGGKAWIVDRADVRTKTLPADRLKHWRLRVSRVATEAMLKSAQTPGESPVALECIFYFSRPKSHLLSSGAVSRRFENAIPRADVDKLVRAIGDALTGVAYKDDNQIVRVLAEKAYTLNDSYTFVSVATA